MSSADYFTKTALVPQTLARASAVNTNLTGIETGFGRLPDKAVLDTGRVTFAVTAGAADVYTLALHKTAAAYYNGMALDIEAHATNTGACTINVDSLGAKAIKAANGTDPEAGDLTSGDYLCLRYDDTAGYFRITSMVRSIINGNASMSDAEIKTAYENNANTNAFTDAQVTKANFITVTDATNLDTIRGYTTLAANGTSQASKAAITNASGNMKFSEEVQAKSFIGTFVAISGTTPTVNCNAGNAFTLTTTGNTTFTFDYSGVDLTTGGFFSFLLKVTTGGTHTLAWPASVDWAAATAPDAPPSGDTNFYGFTTYDGGTSWIGVLIAESVG